MSKRNTLLLAGLVVLLLLPSFISTGLLNGVTKALIAALFALAFNLLMGQGGMLSFGHGAYLGVGAFATMHAMMWVEKGGFLPLPFLPLVGGLAGLLIGLLAGYFATRRTGTYFAMVTLAIAELLHSIALKWAAVFGGEAGLSSMRMPWAGIGFGSAQEVYFLILVWVVISAFVLHLYTLTPFGRVSLAIRDNETRVGFVGINAHRAKTLMFAISAMFAGIAGSLLAITDESVSYALFDARVSALIVLQSFIGGVGVFLGPAVGAAVLTVFSQVVSDASRSWLLYQGLLFILVMMFIPHGIWGSVIERIQSRAKVRQDSDVTSMARIAAGSLLAVLAVIFLVEVAAVLMTPQYEALRRAAGGGSPPVHVLGLNLEPTSFVTWAVPAFMLVVAGGLFLSQRVRRVRDATDER